MHSGTTNHVGKNLHSTDNAQHVLHSIIVAKEFFVILKGKIFAFGTKMLKNRWQRLNRWIFLLLFENLSNLMYKIILHRETPTPFTALQAQSSLSITYTSMVQSEY